MNKLIAAVILAAGTAAFAMAQVAPPTNVPEIDPSSAAAAVSLLAAAAVAIRGRRRR